MSEMERKRVEDVDTIVDVMAKHRPGADPASAP